MKSQPSWDLLAVLAILQITAGVKHMPANSKIFSLARQGKVSRFIHRAGYIKNLEGGMREATTIGTYWAVVRPDGTLFAQGVVMTKDGEMATWIGQGVGKPTGRGLGASWRGAIYYQTSSPKLERLNSVAAVFEFETDESGNTNAEVWEWK